MFRGISFVFGSSIAIAFAAWLLLSFVRVHYATEIEDTSKFLKNRRGEATCVDRQFDFSAVTKFGQLYRGNTGNLVDRSVLCYGSYEFPVTLFMHDVLRNLNISQPVVLDFGAGKGIHVMSLAPFAHEVHAFESSKEDVESLRYHLQKNKLTNLHAYQIGFSDGLERDNSLHGDKVVVRSVINAASYEAGERAEEVSLVLNDSFFVERKIERVDLIRIDVQGYERPILEGLKNLVEKFQPIIVMKFRKGTKLGFSSESDLRGLLSSQYQFLGLKDHVVPQPYELTDFRFPDKGPADDYYVIAFTDSRRSVMVTLYNYL